MEAITETMFKAYVGVQMSGITNMFNVTLVQDLTGLTKDEIILIMKNYGELEEKYS